MESSTSIDNQSNNNITRVPDIDRWTPECTICLDRIEQKPNEQLVHLPCGCAASIVHRSCINELIEHQSKSSHPPKCPHCQKNFQASEVAPLPQAIVNMLREGGRGFCRRCRTLLPENDADGIQHVCVDDRIKLVENNSLRKVDEALRRMAEEENRQRQEARARKLQQEEEERKERKEREELLFLSKNQNGDDNLNNNNNNQKTKKDKNASSTQITRELIFGGPSSSTSSSSAPKSSNSRNNNNNNDDDDDDEDETDEEEPKSKIRVVVESAKELLVYLKGVANSAGGVMKS